VIWFVTAAVVVVLVLDDPGLLLRSVVPNVGGLENRDFVGVVVVGGNVFIVADWDDGSVPAVEK
jgi:hypothetical protein